MSDLAVSGWSEAQADCRRVFEENAQPMWIFGVEGFVEVNRAAELHYGYSRTEFLAMRVRDLEASAGSSEIPSVVQYPAANLQNDTSFK